MALTAGSHHVATATADMDRLIAFYRDVFDAEVVADMREDGLRHVFLDLGGGFVLHPFEIPGVEVPQGELPMFGRGRIDHLALRAADAEAFWAVRERIHQAGAGGEVVDMGPLLSVGFTDPDGLWSEVCWDRPADERRGDGASTAWKRIPYPDRG